ncbi:methyltransferase, FxLD system [Streptomyces sp. NPDC002308]
MAYARADWSAHFAEGRGFARLGDEEKRLLTEHVPAPGGGGRALDACCGTGELAVFLTSLGYAVDGADFAEGALDRARAEHAGAPGVRWLNLDIEHDDPAPLHEDGYDLVTFRLSVAFLRDRSRVLRGLGARLREGGAVVVITPVVTPVADGAASDAAASEERRRIALDEDELVLLADGFEETARFDAAGLAFLVLRRPGGTFVALEKGRPAPQAVVGAAAVVTDPSGRVLLGRSAKGMWELPGGRVETGESAPAAAVRELAEETGLTARADDAHVLAVLHDDRADVRRLTVVVRVVRWGGELGLPEPHRFARWEWHDPHGLATLGNLFAPSAQALHAVWPGVLPGLVPVHSYPCATAVPPVPGEPAEAVRLRARMADAVAEGGWAPSARVRAALREVPRHRFVPETPPAHAYDPTSAVVTVRDCAEEAVSSVSAPWLQADMIERLRLEPGAATVLEIGSGGYDAELLAHVLGERGRVVTVDIDPYVVHRTARLCAEAGSGRVTALLGDGRAGAPAHVPAGGFTGVIVTHTASDIAPAWREQLAEGARLVVPLDINGCTRAVALVRRGEVLAAEGWTYCGFVRDRGSAARTAAVLSLAGGAVTVRWADGAPGGGGDAARLEEALRGPEFEVATGVFVPGGYSFETLLLHVATTEPGSCLLTAAEGSAPGARQDAPALVSDGSLACLTWAQIRGGPEPADRRSEFVVRAHGPAGPELAERLAGCVRAWDRQVRDRGYPAMTVHPAGTPDEELPPGDVLDMPSVRLVLRWPGRTTVRLPAPAAPSAPSAPSAPGGIRV